ncbi:MAG: hypothetical protein JW779_10495 [Candidatus Thorarchaeota archaeon]|nr:hypothetical protein [Candidatus Thorarchaeota archaeon]
MRLKPTGSYFSVVGITPIACANSIASYLMDDRHVPIGDIFFVTSWDERAEPSSTSQQYVKEVIDLLTKNLEHMHSDGLDDITFHPDDIVWIPEENLSLGVKCITEGIFHKTARNERIIIDTTAGRKTMASSAVLAGYILNNRYERKVTLSYYWLRRFSPEIMGKPVYELDSDDAEIVLTDINDLNEMITKIRNQYE